MNRRPSVDVDLNILSDGFELAMELTGQIWFNHAATSYLTKKHPNVCRAYCEMTWKSRTKALEISNEAELKKCAEGNQRFLIIFLTFHYTLSNDNTLLLGHSNAIVVDRKKMTAERFEPNGHFYESSSNLGNLYEEADAAISQFFVSLGLTFVPSLDICPANGVQLKEQAGLFFGFCSTWCVWYMDMRLTYPDTHPWDLNQEILQKVRAMSTAALQAYLKAYVANIYEIAIITFPEYVNEIREGIDPNDPRHADFISQLPRFRE